MRKNVEVTCPHCGSHNVSGWYNEHLIRYTIHCNDCGGHEEVMNIKFVDAFPKWFEIFEEKTDD